MQYFLKKTFLRAALVIILSVVALAVLMPLLWMLLTSVKESGDVFSTPLRWIPWLHFKPTFEPYKQVWTQIAFARYFFNSLFVALTVMAGQVFTSSLAAYAFARLKFPGRDKIFLAYLGTLMVPGVVTVIPVYILMRELHWIDTYQALIVPAMFSAYGTFLLRQFFLSIPREMEEAARIDGCSAFEIYRWVVVPLSLPAMSALAIFTFVGNWRSFLWPLIVTNSPQHYTLPMGLAAFQTMEGGVNWPVLMAGSMLMTLPMVLIFLLGQRYFIEGIRIGGVKG